MEHRYPSYKANPQEGGRSTKRQSQGYPYLVPLKNTITMWEQLQFFLFKWKPFPTIKLGKIYFRSVHVCNSRGKFEIISGLKQVKAKYKYIITLNRYDNFEPLLTTVPIPTWGYLVSMYFMVYLDRFYISGIGGCLALKLLETYIEFR